MPKVSVAVPAYNCESYIAQCLDSLLGQTYSGFELVISDNASTDGTEGICRAYAAKDSRIRYVRRTENIGGPGNFRYVFSLCQGEYHKWSTADDYWDRTFLEKSVAVLESRPDVVLCYPKTQLIDAKSQKIDDYEDILDLQQESAELRFRFLMENIGLCNAHLGLIRRSAMLRTRLIGKELASDVNFLAELSLHGKFLLLAEQLFFRRFHQQSSSWDRKDETHQKKYYDPSGKGPVRSDTWRRYAQLTRSTWQSDIPLGEKLSLTAYLAKLARWDRPELMRKIGGVFRKRGATTPQG